MNTNSQIMKTAKLNDYRSPLTEVMTVVSEGLMCTSTRNGIYSENPEDEINYGWED